MTLKSTFVLAAVSFLALGCSDDPEGPAAPTTGHVEVTTVTTGDDADIDGYTITVDGVDDESIGPNASVTLGALDVGTYSIGLDDVAFNCQTPDVPRDVDVVAGDTVTTQFEVTCVAVNQPPVADAGEDQTIVDLDGSGAQDVTLDGSGSFDKDGTITNYSWSENDEQIAAGQKPRTAFTVGEHLVTLTVTDDQGARDSDDVKITVDPRPDPVSFAAEILPYFGASVANCVLCHSGGTGAAGVNLDSYANIMAGGDSGPLVVPGDANDLSATLAPKLEADHNNGPDDTGFVVTLRRWINEGALDN